MPGITNFPNYFIPQSGKSAVREISDPTMETLRAAASGAGAKRKVSRTVRLTFCHKDSRKNSGATHYSPSDPILPSSLVG